MTYSVELNELDLNYINACILGMVRRAQEKLPELQAIGITTTAAEVVTRLNEARLTTHDVMFINIAIEKTREFLLTDRELAKAQRLQAREVLFQVMQKLAGADRPRNVLEDWS